MSAWYVPPGHEISPPTPAGPGKVLRLGPGLRHVPPIRTTIAGQVRWDERKGAAIWIEHGGGRYVPVQGDMVIAQIHHSSPDYYHCSITPHTSYAQLPQLAFEGATKKTRPQLVSGSLVYARVSLANKHMDPELECVNPSTGKADGGLGELKGGMLFDVSIGFARRLMMPHPAEDGGVVVLDALADRLAFEVAVGRNGRVWVNAASVAEVLAVGRALQETDRGRLRVEEQRKMVKKAFN